VRLRRLLLFLSFLLVFSSSNAFALFKPVDNLASVQIKRVVVSRFNPSLIYVASKNSLYRSQDKAETFRRLAVFKDEEVQHIFFDPYLADSLYVATTRHLYQWKGRLSELYTSPDEEFIYTAGKNKGFLFIGTDQGLYSASADTLTWQKARSLSDVPVYDIESDNKNLYLAAENGVYRVKNRDKAERLLVMRKQEKEENGSQGLIAQVIKIDTRDKNHLWLGTNQGLFVSADAGANWEKLFIPGMDSISVNCLVQTPLQDNTLYVGARQGFFKVDTRKKTSQQIFEGLHSSYIHWIEFTPQGAIYLATPRGLFKSNYFTSAANSSTLNLMLADEPSIQEIQEQALRYNEVHPDKIKKWREKLGKRAWYPTVDIDATGTIDRDTYEIYTSAATNYYVLGPDDKKYTWGVSFSWDLSNLIWNSYEDDVDTRSRLNTQLRLDILDDVNRVYFERVRLKEELAAGSFSTEESFMKNLRLSELTAILDGYTGSYFSHKAKELNE